MRRTCEQRTFKVSHESLSSWSGHDCVAMGWKSVDQLMRI